MNHLSIHADNLGKCFKFYERKWDKLKGAFLKSSNHAQEIWAVRKLNFEISPGTTLGVIGPNGAGKTTLLQLLAGLLKPTEGMIAVKGSLAALMDLQSGFQYELTGRENVFASGALRGFSRKEIERKLPSIIDFSELQDSIDRPLKHYSSGMLMRLGFATAINVEPEVLLIDEVFAVGDAAFQHKCIRKFRELQRKDATVVLISHDMTAIKSLCGLTLLLDRGIPLQFGRTEDVTNYYLNLVAQKFAREEFEEPSERTFTLANAAFRHGTGEGSIFNVETLNAQGAPAQVFAFGEKATFRFSLEYHADVAQSGLGFFIRDRYGNDIVGINTFEEERDLGKRNNGDKVVIDFKFPLYLRPGSYSISPGFSYHPSEPRYLDWIDNAALFEVEKPTSGKIIHGFVYLPNEVTVKVVGQ